MPTTSSEKVLVFGCPYGWERSIVTLSEKHMERGEFVLVGYRDKYEITEIGHPHGTFHVASCGSLRDRVGELYWRMGWIAERPKVSAQVVRR